MRSLPFRFRSIAVLLATLTACAIRSASPIETRTGVSTDAAPLFRFHVDFWANLNQVLLHEALLPRPRWEGPKSLKNHHVTTSDGLEPSEAVPWREALAYYDAHFTTNNLFDHFVSAMPSLLGLSETQVPSSTRELDDDWLNTLRVAAPIYRTRFWPGHQQEGRAYIKTLEPLIAAHGTWFMRRVVSVYGMPLPTEPIDIEVTPAVPPFGGFTQGEPPYTDTHAALITLSCEDPSYAGDTGIEMVFHEVSHLIVGRVQDGLEASAKRQRRTLPPRLWHDLIFYTAGHLARERLGPAYVPFAERPSSQLFSGDSDPSLSLLKRGWQPYLDGRLTFDQAIDATVALAPAAAE